MGDGGRLAGREALEEMGRQAAARLAALPADEPVDDAPSARPAVVDRPFDLPDPAAGLDALIAAAAAACGDWRRRLQDWHGRAVPITAGVPDRSPTR